MEILKTVFNMSITGSIMFFIFLLIKPLTKENFNSSWHYKMLILILIFFIVPIGSFIKLPIKLIPNISPVEIQESKNLDNIIGNDDIKDIQKIEDTKEKKFEDKTKHERLTTIETENYNPNKRNFNLDSYGDIIQYIWLGGIIILFLLKIMPYMKFKSTILKNSLEVEDKEIVELFNLCKEKLNIDNKISLKTCKNIGSPMLIGIFHPTILIPNIDEDEKALKMIFLHELNHYKRKDIIIKTFGFIVNIIHWFNPIVYILLSKIDIYCEYSIDEKVVDKMEIEDRKYYGETILKLIDNFIVKKNSRTRYIISLFVLVLILVSGLAIACNIMPNKVIGGNDSFIDNIKKIEVIFNEDNPHFNGVKLISIKDKKMINDIMSMLEESRPIQNYEKMEKMSGMSYKDNKLILTGVDNEKTEIKYTFDTLYNIGFIEMDGKKLEPKYDFFRYMFDLIEYGEYDTDIDKEVSQLFEKYNWTIDYKVNTIKEKLPSNLKHIAGECPIKIYWAYNNELSKSIGLDFSNYLGNTVEVEIYRLREPLPEYMKPRLNARGIVIKKDGKIIGAYIDAGRHESFACSLNRKSLKDIVNKDWDEWIQDCIDYNDKLEKELAKLSPEEIIKTYFKALNSHDVKIAKACLSRTQSNVGGDLSRNMSNRELYNKKADDYFDNIKSVRLLKIEKLDKETIKSETLNYQVEADYKYKKVITHEDGVLPFIVVMRKESEKSGWKIEDIGF